MSQHAAAQTACSDLTDARWQKLTHNQILLFSTAQRHFARALPDFCTKISQSNQSQISQITFWKSVSRVNDYWTPKWWPSCCRVPAALYFFCFSHVCCSTPLTQLTSTPQICSHGIKKWIWTETRVTWCILWAEEFSSLPGLQPCRLTRWTLVPRQAVTHIKTSFLDSFTNVTLNNTKSNNLSLLSVTSALQRRPMRETLVAVLLLSTNKTT